MAYLDRLDNEIKALKEEALRMCWYMRGGISYPDIMQMSTSERDIISNIIKSNLETTKETKMPFF